MRVLYELRICMCTQIREKSRSHRLFPGGALARVNKLSRFISFFHRLARTPYIYIFFPSACREYYASRTLAQVTEKFIPPACQPRPRKRPSIIGPDSRSEAHSEFTVLNLPSMKCCRRGMNYETSSPTRWKKMNEWINFTSHFSNNYFSIITEIRSTAHVSKWSAEARRVERRTHRRGRVVRCRGREVPLCVFLTCTIHAWLSRYL